MTKITSNDNVGGTRLIRGYAEVEKWKKRNEEEIKRSKSKRGRNKRKKLVYEDEDARSIEGEGSSNYTSPDGSPIQSKYPEKSSTEFSINNYAVNSDKNENDYRYNKIEHLVFVVHGIGEKFAEDKSVATIEKSMLKNKFYLFIFIYIFIYFYLFFLFIHFYLFIYLFIYLLIYYYYYNIIIFILLY